MPTNTLITVKHTHFYKQFLYSHRKTQESKKVKQNHVEFPPTTELPTERLKEYLGIANEEIMNKVKVAWEIAKTALCAQPPMSKRK